VKKIIFRLTGHYEKIKFTGHGEKNQLTGHGEKRASFLQPSFHRINPKFANAFLKILQVFHIIHFRFNMMCWKNPSPTLEFLGIPYPLNCKVYILQDLPERQKTCILTIVAEKISKTIE
jgi:hypothetical protein